MDDIRPATDQQPSPSRKKFYVLVGDVTYTILAVDLMIGLEGELIFRDEKSWCVARFRKWDNVCEAAAIGNPIRIIG